jgi:hypothetical protein
VSLENQFTGAVEVHFLAGDSLDGGRIALERLHAVLQFLVFVVQLVDLLADLGGLLLRAAHRQHAMCPKNILQQEQRKPTGKKPVEIPAQKFAHLLGKSFALPGLRRIHSLLTQVCASSASFCDAAGEAASV